MNLSMLFFSAIIILIVLAVCFSFKVKNKRIIGAILFCTLGVLIFSFGICLFSASMWRSIAIGLLCIGGFMGIVGLIFLFKEHKK